MKLDCVLTAVNENPMYIDFVPIFIKTWNKLYPDVRVKIILIAKKIPKDLILHKDNIILFEPIQDVSTSFTSQFIRNLYPCILNYKNAVMITDIDNLPMNRTFFTKNIENISDNKWINLRDCKTSNEICMMWQVAKPDTWKQVFHIHNLQDIKDTLISVNNTINYVDGHGCSGWCTDQEFLYEKVMKWNEKTKNYIFLKDKNTGFRRWDGRGFTSLDSIGKKEIAEGKYSDYHALRPMSRYSDINWQIYNLLPTKNNDVNYISGHEFYNKLNVIPITDVNYFNQYQRGYVKDKFRINVNEPISTQKIEISKLVNPIFLLKYGSLQYFYTHILSQLKSKFVLVTCLGDETLPEIRQYYREDIINSQLLHKWYGTNMNFIHKKVDCIPLGLENTNWKRVKTHLIEKHNKNKKNKLLYLNFNTATHSSRTHNLNKLLERGFTLNKKLPWDDYINDLSQHKFCISPRGNGIDCHRHWECLYLGVIPIVEKSIVIDSIKELPLLIVDNYNEITTEYLNKKYDEMTKKNYCLEKLDINYWINKIEFFNPSDI